ncbi:hypothetical protein GC176_14000 [bacterium]|nr:hypothetical protein [bacterium]
MPATAAHTAETRPLPLRRRPDLTCREQQFGGTTYWHVKDPIALRYFQLKPEEYAVLQMLDGTVSLRDIRRRFEQQFAPQRLAPMQIQSFLGMLHGSGLIVSETPGQAEHLIERTRQQNWQRLVSAVSSVLAIRLPGFDPHRFLNWLVPQVRFAFSPVCVTLCLTLMAGALLLAGLHSDALTARLPRFHELFSAGNLFWLAVTLGATKVLHELGHAVACRHFGAECHEMGLMLLVFTPCLYCNVSDAWMLPKRWHRIAISAAGVYVELVLASVCLFLWWFSVPGPFNAACLNVVLVCSISTLLFNGNPLLRYDGYYILSDLVEIPNLRQQAGALIRNALSQIFLGTEIGNQRLLPDRRRGFLIGWSLAALVYRIVVVWSILWFVHAVLKPYGLQALAVAVGILTVAGIVLVPLVKLVTLLRNPFWSRTVNWPRFRIRSAIALVMIAGLATLPLPCSVTAPAIIQAEGARSVYVGVPGRLVEAATPGETVAADEVVGRLENLDIERSVASLEGDVTQLERQLDTLQRRRIRDPEAVESLIPTTQQQLADKRDELRQRKLDQERLTLRTPVAGTILPPSDRLDPAGQDETQAVNERTLPQWTGTPLDVSNLGATLEVGTEFCLVSSSGRFEAVAAVSESDVELVAVGQRVDLLVDHLADRWLSGAVADIAEVDLTEAPRELTEHEDFPTRLDADGSVRPAATAYQVRVRLDADRSLPFTLRAPARIRIEVTDRSLAQRTLRFMRQTFRFR